MNTIKIIDVYGQFDDQGTNHYYTFFSDKVDPPVGWKNVMNDPRGELSDGIQQCYVVWSTASDWWLGKVIKNPHDSRAGFAMLSICLGPYRPMDGGKTVAVLDSLAQFFIIEKNWNDIDSEKVLFNIESDFPVVPCSPRQFASPSISVKAAYRSYDSKQDLGKYLSFLPQKGYEKYPRIFFVPKEEAQGMPITCLDSTMQLKNIYILDCPKDCTPSPIQSEIMEGEELKLTYIKAGFEPIERFIKGGVPSEYAFVEGLTMHIKSGKDLGLIHDRVVEIICQDKTGKRIDGFTLRNHTQQNNAISFRRNKVYIPENVTQEAIVRVVPDDGQFAPVKVDLNEKRENPIVLTLEPKKYKVVFKMNDKEFETTEDNAMNPSEVQKYWSAYDSKIDDLNEVIYFRAHRKQPERKSFGERIVNFLKEWWLHLLIVLATLLVLGYGIYAAVLLFGKGERPWPFRSSIEAPDTTNNMGDTIVMGSKEHSEEEKEIDTVALFQQDVEYLKKNDEWIRDSIQTKEFQGLYDVIASGKTNDVVLSYNTLFGEGVEVNGYLRKIVKGVKQILEKNDGQLIAKASDEMKKMGQSGSVNLIKLYEGLNSLFKPEPSAPIKQNNVEQPPVLKPKQNTTGDGNNGGHPRSGE